MPNRTEWSKICSMVKNLYFKSDTKKLENVVYENYSDHDELGKLTLSFSFCKHRSSSI